MADEFSEPVFDNHPPQGQQSNFLFIILVVAGVTLLGCGGIFVALLLPAVEQARGAAQRSASKNNLKQIGLALHNYHDTYGVLPPGSIQAENGTDHQSWMYSILPYVEQNPLFTQIDPDYPWNSPQDISSYKNGAANLPQSCS